MFMAIRRVLDEHKDINTTYPIHINPTARKASEDVFWNDDRIWMIEPLDVLNFHNFMYRSYLILTDSGGLHEEAPSLGNRCR